MQPAVNIQNEEQRDLSPAFHWMRKAGKLRALLNRAVAANQLTHEFLARETGIDERQIGRALSDNGGAHPPLALVACIAWHDKAGVLIQGFATLLGYEAKPKTPDLAAENKRLRDELVRLRDEVNRAIEGTP